MLVIQVFILGLDPRTHVEARCGSGACTCSFSTEEAEAGVSMELAGQPV